MTNTKPTGLEIAVGPDSGVLYKRAGAGKMPRDIVTWQDQDEFRIWIHSRETDQGYKPVSLEVQLRGKQRGSKGVDPSEAKARATLAALAPADLGRARIGHALMRQLSIGHLMEQNSILVSNEQARNTKTSERKLKLVDSDKDEFRKLNIPVHKKKSLAGFNSEIRATNSDSLLIAFIYAQLSSTGNKKAAQHAALMLNIDPKFVYTAVRNARKKGWLTSEGLGSAGGEMTTEGLAAFEKGDGRSRYEAFVKAYFLKGNE
jgi:hypothetical protein